MRPWFIQYNAFLTKDQKGKAANLILQKIRNFSRSPLVYVLGFQFFSSHIVRPRILKKLLVQAAVLFPDSLFVKESLLWTLSTFFPKKKDSAHLIEKFIFPFLSPLDPTKKHLYSLLGQYFQKRKILDSALFYTQMGKFYHSSPSWKFVMALQETAIYFPYSSKKELVEIVLQNSGLWNSSSIREQMREILQSYGVFWPSKDLSQIALWIEPEKISTQNKQTGQYSRYRLPVIYALCILAFTAIVLILFWLRA